MITPTASLLGGQQQQQQQKKKKKKKKKDGTHTSSGASTPAISMSSLLSVPCVSQ
ncbi:hypothetical protein PAXRUDRAFT_17044 [Paxillus rubicundulus Ve08.2h10]|uniref:Uncharacterized protein n=1 Tax=Paxillus rubicundulus Ve08.2h10 TaxID=930991 RepID=A0A0D0C4S7_9AGAM|nr:hypothetical protein PAXRUDRAFT_17044 [Paxillus rubicundulus Ve08.2h10]